MSADSLLGNNFAIMVAGMDGITQRMQVNQNNIAGITSGNTGYVPQTVDFESSLRAAINTPAGSSSVQGNADSLTGAGTLNHGFVVKNDPNASTDTSIEKDQIVNQMAQDNVKYRVLEQQVSNRISELKQVITAMRSS